LAPAFPIATVATGMPPGICTVDSKASIPCRLPAAMGTPMTGFTVWAAVAPARWAASPAAAMNTWQPLLSAVSMYSWVWVGVRCADRIFTSWGMLNSFKMVMQCSMVFRSELEPIKIATKF